jgi:hypothetical protein
MTDRLARFTPNAAGLDRDALLFAAGRQSARSSRFWRFAALLLGLSQAVTLTLLWPREGPASVVAPPAPPAGSVTQPFAPPVSPDPDVWTVRSSPDVLLDSTSAAAGEFVSTGPPLTAGSGRRFD